MITKDTPLRKLADLLWSPSVAYKEALLKTEKENGAGEDELKYVHGPGVHINCQLDYLDVEYHFGKIIELKPFVKFMEKIEELGGDGTILLDERQMVSVNFIDQQVFNK